MRPKEILQRWVEYFNQYDYERLGELYAKDCINHQTPNGIIKGKENDKIVWIS
jgi:ketosteroid isomerase-like protein